MVGVCYNSKSQSMYKFLNHLEGCTRENMIVCLFTEGLLCMFIQRFSHHCSAHTKSHPYLCDLCIPMTLKKLQKAKQTTYLIVYKSRKETFLFQLKFLFFVFVFSEGRHKNTTNLLDIYENAPEFHKTYSRITPLY